MASGCTQRTPSDVVVVAVARGRSELSSSFAGDAGRFVVSSALVAARTR